jgi:hypothetical protein
VGLLLYGARQSRDGVRPFGTDADSIRERFLGWVRELF